MCQGAVRFIRQMPSPRSKRLLAATVFLGSTVVLALQLINPSPVVVAVGDNGTEVTEELGEYFLYRDVAIIAISAFSLGVSATYLLTVETANRDNSIWTTDHSQAEPERPTMTSTDGGEKPKPSERLLEARKQEWEETAERLASKEQEVYEALLAADGVLPQSEIVEQTELSKASVSRALDGLEVKNLVERKRRGMGNIVLLQ